MKPWGRASTKAREEAPGLDLPTPETTPWYPWLLWPIVGVLALGLAMLLMRGCISTVTP
ncbi:MAG TPA: hypothetical protein VMU54_13725 [Planctomycetota bacterium]|nr:hypothetical protein [Planctomycetota bacterium]